MHHDCVHASPPVPRTNVGRIIQLDGGGLWAHIKLIHGYTELVPLEIRERRDCLVTRYEIAAVEN